MGTADDNYAGYFYNNSSGFRTLTAQNSASGGNSGLFKVFKASTPLGTCGIGDGDLSCTGQLKTLASTGEGARTVETYAPQAAENWMEDYGTGAMHGGVGVVQIDPAFAETVTADASYHVFLTQRGDSKGPLYVTNATASSFEVREANGGTSSIIFDYKIVAKRRGYEAQRLVDVTDRFNAEQATTKRMTPDAGTRAAYKGTVRRAQAAGPTPATPLGATPKLRPGGVVPSVVSSGQKPVAKPI